MSYKDEKENIIENNSEAEKKISDDAASALENGTFEEKSKESAESENEEKESDNNDADKKEKDSKEKKNKKTRKNPFSTRKFKKGGYAIILTCFVIVAVVIVNIISNVLQTKVPAFSLDMTGKNLYELSDSSKEIVSAVEDEITITILANEDTYTQTDEYFLQAYTLLKKYCAENDKIKIEFVDLTSNPTYVNMYPNESLTNYSYIVSCGDRYKYLGVSTDLFSFSTDSYTGESYVSESNVESAVTTAIIFVTSEDQPKVAVLSGFSSNSDSMLSNLTTVLKANNYEVSDVNLLSEDIPEDSDIAILYQPISDLTEDAVDRITTFLDNEGKLGKNFFYVPYSQKVETPNIDSILEEWGMSLGQGMVAEMDTSYMPYQGDYYCSIYDYTSSEYTEGLNDTTKYLIGVYTRPIFINDSSRVVSLATTSQQCALLSFDNYEDTNWNPADHIEGSFNAGAVSTKTSDGNSSKFVVWGSAMSMYDTFFKSSTFVNGEYFVNLFNNLVGIEDSTITIDSKDVTTSQLGIMTDQIVVIGPIFAYVIPILIAIIGLVVCIRRRFR